ncbi:MAG: CAP domain-containing protein [Actinomycetes bacterium]
MTTTTPRLTLRAAVLAVLTLLLLTGLPLAPAAHAGAAEDADFVARLNNARAAAGLAGLVVAGDLTTNATAHSQRMASSNTLYHNPNLATEVTNWVALGENVGYGGSVASIHDALMASPGHRANILSTTFTEVGVGTVWSGGRLWVTQVFRKPAVARQTDIDRKYATLASVLGLPTSAELALPDGRFRHYQVGSLYQKSGSAPFEVRGAIRGEWAALGWERSALGWPRTDELGTPDRRGRFNHFERGSLYWTPTTGAREVRGAIRNTWARLGWENSVLGYPLTHELPTPDGKGRFNHFERGSVYWTRGTGAHEVFGSIRSKWSQLGWERSAIGYPVTGEMVTPDRKGRYNHFQRGSIYWTPKTGPHEVRGAIRDAWAATGWELGPLGYPVSDEYAVSNGRRTDFERGSIIWDSRSRTTRIV